MIQQGDGLTPLYTPSHVFPDEDFDRIHRITGKPILIGDHQIGFADEKHPDIVWGPPGTNRGAGGGGGPTITSPSTAS